jgi:8-oxo-dGTP diphosphatase
MTHHEPDQRFRAAVAVYGMLSKDGRLLLMRRAGSGYHDGELSLPAGHVEGGETALAALLRELREELTIDVDPASCRLRVVVHRAPEPPSVDEYVDLFFTVDRWTGKPEIGDPEQCSELLWVTSASLPDDVIPYVSTALQAAARGESLVLHGWDKKSN